MSQIITNAATVAAFVNGIRMQGRAVDLVGGSVLRNIFADNDVSDVKVADKVQAAFMVAVRDRFLSTAPAAVRNELNGLTAREAEAAYKAGSLSDGAADLFRDMRNGKVNASKAMRIVRAALEDASVRDAVSEYLNGTRKFGSLLDLVTGKHATDTEGEGETGADAPEGAREYDAVKDFALILQIVKRAQNTGPEAVADLAGKLAEAVAMLTTK